MLSATTPTVDHATNGTTDTFAYAFKIFDDSDLVVELIDGSNNSTTQTLNTDYTVTGAGVYTGGNVVFVSAPADNLTCRITRSLPYTQTVTLASQINVYPPAIEEALDRLTALIQQLEQRIDVLEA